MPNSSAGEPAAMAELAQTLNRAATDRFIAHSMGYHDQLGLAGTPGSDGVGVTGVGVVVGGSVGGSVGGCACGAVGVVGVTGRFNCC